MASPASYILPPLPVRYFDTFSGIGGFAIPLSELGHECVGFSEIDRYASQVYLSHFPSHRPYGDITRLDPAALPDFDLIVGGFPCQAFSIAGKRRGFLDTRGTLFFDVCRIAAEKRPRLLLLENVKGLLNHAAGETFRTILGSLDELGYDAEWQVCNSRHFGVPQNRERVFLVGHLRGQPGPEVFPLADGDREDRTPDVRQAEGLYAGTISLKNQSGQCQFDGGTTLIAYPGHAVNHPGGVASTLKAGTHDMPGGEGLVAVAIRGRNSEATAECRSDGVSNALRSSEGGSSKAMVSDGVAIRRLTPVECERLQGFPDNWTVGHSDTQRYKMLGNAVTVNVVREIAQRLA